jgi:hypothetical protein
MIINGSKNYCVLLVPLLNILSMYENGSLTNTVSTSEYIIIMSFLSFVGRVESMPSRPKLYLQSNFLPPFPPIVPSLRHRWIDHDVSLHDLYPHVMHQVRRHIILDYHVDHILRIVVHVFPVHL